MAYRDTPAYILADLIDNIHRKYQGANWYDKLVTTLDVWWDDRVDIKFGSRRMGNTTRQVNYAVDQLFKGNTVLCLDHHQEGENRMANERLANLIMKRLYNEHQFMFDRFVFKKNDLLIYLKDK